MAGFVNDTMRLALAGLVILGIVGCGLLVWGRVTGNTGGIGVGGRLILGAIAGAFLLGAVGWVVAFGFRELLDKTGEDGDGVEGRGPCAAEFDDWLDDGSDASYRRWSDCRARDYCDGADNVADSRDPGDLDDPNNPTMCPPGWDQ